MNPSIREEIRNLKKDKIVEVAARLFFERGYHGSSIDSICAELGVTKPFFYYHFQKKDDILKAIYMSALEAALNIIQPLNAGGLTPSAKLTAFVREYVGLATSEMRLRIALISREQNLLPKEMMGEVTAMKRKILSEVESLLRSGLAADEFDIDDVTIVAQSIFGILNWTVTWFRPDGRISRETLADEHARACQRLVGAKVRRAAKLSAA
jgi:AcrR family transcriptional regulator